MRSHSLSTSFKLSGRPLPAKNSTRLSSTQSIFQYSINQIRHFVGKMCKNAVCKQKVGMFSYQDKYVQVSELKTGRAQCNYIVLSSVMIKFVSPRSNSPPQLGMSQAWSLETTKKCTEEGFQNLTLFLHCFNVPDKCSIVSQPRTHFISVISCQRGPNSNLALSVQIILMKCNPLKCPECISVIALNREAGDISKLQLLNMALRSSALIRYFLGI